MNIDGWRYYNHAAIPTCAPHEEPELTPIKNGSIWKMGGYRIISKMDHRLGLQRGDEVLVCD